MPGGLTPGIPVVIKRQCFLNGLAGGWGYDEGGID